MVEIDEITPKDLGSSGCKIFIRPELLRGKGVGGAWGLAWPFFLLLPFFFLISGLGIESRISYMLDKHSVTELHPSPSLHY
jgi:hypothetical protein